MGPEPCPADIANRPVTRSRHGARGAHHASQPHSQAKCRTNYCVTLPSISVLVDIHNLLHIPAWSRPRGPQFHYGAKGRSDRKGPCLVLFFVSPGIGERIVMQGRCCALLAHIKFVFLSSASSTRSTSPPLHKRALVKEPPAVCTRGTSHPSFNLCKVVDHCLCCLVLLDY